LTPQQLQTEAHAAPPPHSLRHRRSHGLEPPELDDDEADDDDEVVAPAVSLQRPSASWTQTPWAVWFARREAASAQVAKMPIGQIAAPHAQTRSTALPRMRKPQFGIVWVSTTTSGQIEVATQSSLPDCCSVPHPPPATPPSTVIAASLAPASAPPLLLLLPFPS
jgi:hypothetical protein